MKGRGRKKKDENTRDYEELIIIRKGKRAEMKEEVDMAEAHGRQAEKRSQGEREAAGKEEETG